MSNFPGYRRNKAMEGAINSQVRDAAIEKALLRLVPAGAALACGPVFDATDSLFPKELDQIARAVEKRRQEFSTGRHYARIALGKVGHPPVALPTDEKRRPCWPNDTVGSITHIDNFCAVIVAPRQSVTALGLDIERIEDVSATLLPHLSELHEQEELLRHVSPKLLPALTFSAREAVFKSYHPVTDHFLDFKDIRLSVSDDRFIAQILHPQFPRLMGQTQIHGKFLVAQDLVISVVSVLT